MKTKYILLAVALVLVPLGVFVACSKGTAQAPAADAQKAAQKYTCPMHPQYVVDKPGECPICGMNLVAMEHEHVAPSSAPAQPPKKIIKYRSTMNPNEISDKPGKDSMGMEMEPFEVEAAPQGPTVQGLAPVTISPEKQQLIGVKTEPARRRELAKTIRTVGKVAYDPDLYYAEQEYISTLKANQKAQDAADTAIGESSRSLVESSRLRLKLMGLGDEQIEALASKGTPDSSLLLTDKSGNAWIYASVYESDLRLVKPGQRAKVTMPSSATEAFEGQIIAIDPVLDPQTRNARARIRVDNRKGVLRPEVYVNVDISVPLGSGLVVPANAVMDTGTRQVVFVNKGNGVLEPREIKTEVRSDDAYLVRSGIAEGENVVTNANFLIDSESQLKASMQAAGGGHKH